MGGEGRKQMDDGCRWLAEGEKKVWKWRSMRIWSEIAEGAVESPVLPLRRPREKLDESVLEKTSLFRD